MYPTPKPRHDNTLPSPPWVDAKVILKHRPPNSLPLDLQLQDGSQEGSPLHCEVFMYIKYETPMRHSKKAVFSLNQNSVLPYNYGFLLFL